MFENRPTRESTAVTAEEKQNQLEREVLNAEQKKQQLDQTTLDTIFELREKMETKKIELSQAVSEIENLEDQIATKESSIIGKLSNFFEIQALRKRLGTKRENFTELSDQYEQIRSSIHEMEQIVLDRRQVASARAELALYQIEQQEMSEAKNESERQRLQEEQELLVTIEQEKKIRDLSSILEQNDAVCVHMFGDGIGDEGKKGVMKFGKSDLETKFNVLLGMQPELSTSTLRNGNQNDKTFGPDANPVGLILRAGRIETARATDAQTFMKEGRRVSYFDRNQKGLSELQQRIQGAVDKEGDDYNELAVSQPDFAGMFVSPTVLLLTESAGLLRVSDRHSDLMARAVQQAQRLDMPFYTQNKQSQFVKLEIISDGTFQVGEPISSKNVLDNGFKLSDEHMKDAREHVFEDSPFKIENVEAELFDNWKDTMKITNMLLDGERVVGVNAGDFQPDEWTTVDDWVEYIKKRVTELDDIPVLKKRAAVRLKGIADVLRERGDQSSENYLSLATQYEASQTLDDFFYRRVSEKGTFRLSQDDLTQLSAS